MILSPHDICPSITISAAQISIHQSISLRKRAVWLLADQAILYTHSFDRLSDEHRVFHYIAISTSIALIKIKNYK